MSFMNIIGLSLAEIAGDFSLQKYVLTGSIAALSAGYIGYLAVIMFLIKCLHAKNILNVNLLWDGTSVLIESFAAMAILGQTFTGIGQWLGASMIVGGLYLLK